MYRIIDFNKRFASTVLGWAQTPNELMNWASVAEFPLTDISVFDKWHSDHDIHPYLMKIDNNVVGYGEIWFDATDLSVEIGRLIIDPLHRNLGYGQRMISMLLGQISNNEYRSVAIRLHPNNTVAQRCYVRAGFKRVSEETERDYNKRQPRDYIWMSRRF